MTKNLNHKQMYIRIILLLVKKEIKLKKVYFKKWN